MEKERTRTLTETVDAVAIVGLLLLLLFFFPVTCKHSAHSLEPPRWPCGKASTSRAADLGLIPTFAVDLFPGRLRPAT